VGTPYFPGCTLSTKAKNFDQSGRAVAEALGMPLDELPDWQCCGASFPLTTDNSMALIGPTRVLIQAEQRGDRVATLCAICYNVLKRTAVALKQHPEQQERINWFVSTDATTEGLTYQAKVKVVHLLEMLRDDLGWEALRQRVAAVADAAGANGINKVRGLKIAPYYGCLLLRPPNEMALDDPEAPTLMSDFLRAIGAEPVEFAFQSECCGSYLAASKPEVSQGLSGTILEQAARAGAQALVTACPLCQYNLDKRASTERAGARLPVLYFTQLLAVALGLPPAAWALEGHYIKPDSLFA
jgi:heterodisulfide reductase subunit B2